MNCRTPGRLVGQRALVELAQDRVARAGQQIGGDLGPALRDAGVVELAADKAQQRRLDLGVGQLGAAGDETHDRLGDFLGDQLPARLQHGGKRLRAGHAGQPHPVLRDRGHDALHAFEMGEIVLAQRDQYPVVAAGKIESLGGCFVLLDPGFERFGRAVLDQVGEILEELRGTLAAEVVALRKREDFLELVEYQQRDQRLARRVAQDVVAVVQEFPQRFAADRHPRLRPLSERLRSPENGLLDLLRRLGRVGRVVDPNVDRTVTFGAKARYDARAQDRRLAESRLTEKDRQQLALHAPAKLGDLVLAAIEIGARLLGERGKTEPRMLLRRRPLPGADCPATETRRYSLSKVVGVNRMAIAA